MKNQLLPFILLFSLFSWIFSACQPANSQQTVVPETTFEKEFINQHNGYSEAVVVTTGDIQTIYISGQIGEGENFEAQMRSAIKNLEKTLAASGATMKDVVKMNTYIVDYTPETLDIFRNVRKEVLGDEKMPASTLVGVDALALKEWLIEIEAVAVIKK